MKNAVICVWICFCLGGVAGCAGGPPHDYYSPAIVDGPKFKGPITMEMVDDIESSKRKCLAEGWVFIGSSDYAGDQPKANELRAQARRAHANHVVYSVHGLPGSGGGWHFNFSRFGGGGGTDNGYNQVRILYLGK